MSQSQEPTRHWYLEGCDWLKLVRGCIPISFWFNQSYPSNIIQPFARVSYTPCRCRSQRAAFVAVEGLAVAVTAVAVPGVAAVAVGGVAVLGGTEQDEASHDVRGRASKQNKDIIVVD